MKTNNKTQNRVQAYLSLPVYKAFCEYRKTEKLNQSQAMEKILSDFLLKKDQRCSIADNNQNKIKDLQYRLSEVENIIKTRNYLDREKVNTNSLKVTN